MTVASVSVSVATILLLVTTDSVASLLLTGAPLYFSFYFFSNCPCSIFISVYIFFHYEKYFIIDNYIL